MFARDALLPWRTALRNVTLGLEPLKLPAAEVRKRASMMLGRVKLGDFLDAYPSQLSQGMRQRVALARTFALPSQVLLMDEPFAALDAHLRIEAGDLLLQLWEQDRRTVVFVTHDLHEAIALADRVIVFHPRPGRIATELRVPFSRPRSVEELQENPEYHDLYRHLWRAMATGEGR
jgi:NitT/TauT family transport system ATP-binding protein